MSAQVQLDRLLRRAAGDPGVLAVLLFGSAARGDAGVGSDVDVCLVLPDFLGRRASRVGARALRPRQLTSGLAATPAQRLAWLEEARAFAYRHGALPRTDE